MNNKKNETISDSKLIRVLSLLTEKEFKSLKKWLASPWCNSNKKLVIFYRLLEKQYGKFDAMKLGKLTLFGRLYPGKAYNNNMLNNLMRDFVRQIESFLVHDKVKADEQQKDWVLKDIYLKKRDYKAFSGISQKLIDRQNQIPVKEWGDYLHLGLLYEQLYFRPDETVQPQNDQHNLTEAARNLDRFYALTRLRIANEQVLRQRILRATTPAFSSFRHLESLVKFVDHPAVILYHKRLKNRNKRSLRIYLHFKTLFLQHYSNIPETDRKVFFTSAMNDIIALCSQGVMDAYHEMYELMRFGIDEELNFREVPITDKGFVNYVQIATLSQEEALIKKILPDYLPLLKPEFKAEAETWAKAQILYSRGEPEACADLVIPFHFQHKLYAIVSKVTLLKTYFDLYISGKTSTLHFESYCSAFEQYMRRTDFVTTERAEAYLRLIQYTRRIARLLTRNDFDGDTIVLKMEKIKARINKEKQLIGKLWLFKHLEEIRTQ